MMIDASVAKIFVGTSANDLGELLTSRLDIERAARDTLEEIAQLFV